MSTPLVVLEYVKALVWPTVAVVALVVFRRQLRTLVERLTRLEALGASAEFERAVAGVADALPPVPRAPGEPRVVKVAHLEEVVRVAEIYRTADRPLLVDISALDFGEPAFVLFLAGLVLGSGGSSSRAGTHMYLIERPSAPLAPSPAANS